MVGNREVPQPSRLYLAKIRLPLGSDQLLQLGRFRGAESPSEPPQAEPADFANYPADDYLHFGRMLLNKGERDGVHMHPFQLQERRWGHEMVPVTAYCLPLRRLNRDTLRRVS